MLKNMCRVCGRYAAYKRSKKISESENTMWNIQVLTGLVLDTADCLPDLICICCQTELREAIRFRGRVIKAQRELLAGLTAEQLHKISPDFREAVMEYSEMNRQNSTPSHSSDEETEMKTVSAAEMDEELIIEEHPKEEELFTEENAKGADSMEYDIIIDDNMIKEETEEHSQHYEPVEDQAAEQHYTMVEEICENRVNDNLVVPEKESDEECAMLDKVLNDDIAAAQSTVKKKPGRKRIGSLIYICEECGNHISGRMAFDLHCRRHRGDKQFQCDICRDRFCTSSELKRHMRKHTGERPFACQYCGRCFTDYSTRVKHERTHTNERPYVCQNCGKAFTTAYILKNHMLIHSGERAFSCELCNKSFIRQTHLVTHYRSSAHKRNLEQQSLKPAVNH